MDKDEIISFQTALDHTKTTTRSILLGNGFSRSISPRFSYEDLLELTNNIEKMQEHQLPAELRHLFQGLDTVDFEKVIAHLEIAQIVLYSYSKKDGGENTCSQLEQKINSDKESAKTTFVHAINYTHDNLARNILPLLMRMQIIISIIKLRIAILIQFTLGFLIQMTVI